MKFVLFNGSPRNQKSNTKILLEHFLRGYNRVNPESVPVSYLANRKLKDDHLTAFRDSNIVIVAFPLYTDSMPGIVKEFFEDIARSGISGSKKMGFIVQSGFPEAIHSIYIERYLEKFTARMKCEYLGTIIKGGVEGIQMMPPFMTRKLFGRFEALGVYFATNFGFSKAIGAKLRRPYKMTAMGRFIFSIVSRTGLTNYYWNSNLKKNNAYDKRFDQPFSRKADS
ncbi:MAG: NAD(P)H-dependent oxidoreductase [Bacteroidales bacterium]|nr:NAD(P)H-dependent oxidoreductase [Bacteroidales bacterium]